MLAQSVGAADVIVVVGYMLVMGFLGYLGWRRTKTAADYMLAGRKTHPMIMAMSYGATFISTSAIVGFGGVAAMFGMSLLWLTFLNIFVGIFIAFVFLGAPTRRMGHKLNAHTFPELLGRRFNSKFIQVFTGAIIFIFMPLYAAAVLIGGSEFLTTHFNIEYGLAVLILGTITALYVVWGGLKGVLYTDALQGTIMLVGMLILLVWAYSMMGGVEKAHSDLTAMGVPALFKGIGHRGWTAMPEFGWGEKKYDLWWTVVSTITLGVGIGVLAQPQLAVRFMTVKSKKELNRAVILGGLFILAIPGTAYVVGSMSNLYFNKYEKVTGRLVAVTERADVIVKKDAGAPPVTMPCRLLHINTRADDATGLAAADVNVIAEGLDKAAALMPHAEIKDLGDGRVEVSPHANSFMRALVLSKGQWMLNADSIIPIFIKSAMPPWYGLLFLVILLAAAMSTLSGQYHAMGTSITHDVYCQLRPGSFQPSSKILMIRAGIIVGIILAVTIGYFARGEYIIARATSIFFEICLVAFLPTYIGGLFWKRMTKAGAIASVVVGFFSGALWLLLVKAKEAGDLGLVLTITGGKTSILWDHPNWPVVDAVVVALPLSILTAVVVSLLTRPPSRLHLDRCFANSPAEQPQSQLVESTR